MAASVKAYFDLMRLKNVALAAITVPLGAQFAMGDAWISRSFTRSYSQTFAVVFFIGAGNTMNDIKDIDIDKEAHPNRPLACGAISLKNAKNICQTFVGIEYSMPCRWYSAITPKQ